MERKYSSSSGCNVGRVTDSEGFPKNRCSDPRIPPETLQQVSLDHAFGGVE